MSKKTKQYDLADDPYAARERAKYPQATASREYILQIVKALGPPVTAAEIATALGLDKQDEEKQDVLGYRLRAMVRDGELLLNRRGGLIPVAEEDLVKGRIQGHPDGYGFLLPDNGGEDLYIHYRQMRELFHGDYVVMRKSGYAVRGKVEARLVEVIQRANTHIVGQFLLEGAAYFVAPENKRITHDILVAPEHTLGAVPGQIVKVLITHPPTRRHQAQGQIVEVMGDHMAPGMETDIAIHSHHLPFIWPDAVIEEAAAFGDSVSAQDKQGRVDYCDLPLLTIDGEDARDFDDALYARRRKQGGWQLYVAIADVAHYVKPGSSLDEEAQKRATSVYFPDRVLPMLPESLSNGLCSLNPDVERLCLMCELSISDQGDIEHAEFKEGVFRSVARTTYTEIAELCVPGENAAKERYAHLLADIDTLYQLSLTLRAAKEQRGAIDFDSVETKFEFSEDKKIKAIVPAARTVAHRLVEECMLAANNAAANFLEKRHIPVLYRVHDTPDAEKYEDLRQFLKEFALSLPASKRPDVSDYSAILKQAAGRPEARLIQTVLLRSMKQAVYAPECRGHFGLALTHYTHFTSPIRRYPDLLVHRAIKHLIHGKSVSDYRYEQSEMSAFGEHCSVAERKADEATRDAEDWLKCEFMLDKLGMSYQGMITCVTSFGIFVELDTVYVEGMVHITHLDKDYFVYDAAAHRLTGRKTGKVYRLADRVRVKVANVSLDQSKIDLVLDTDEP